MIRMVRRGAQLAVTTLVAGVAFAAPAGPAAAAGPLTLAATYTSIADGWVKVERWYDANPGFVAADIPYPWLN